MDYSIIDLLKVKALISLSNYADDYHLKEIKFNLFEAPYTGIDSRANSIRSSAAMIYNTIGKSEITIDGKRYSNIEYEYKLPAIDNKDNSDHDHSAQLDVKLETKNELLFIEAKCLEWLTAPKKLKRAYLSDYCYFDYTGKAISKFKNAFLCLLEQPQDFHANEKEVHYERYDAVQMTIHILGIYNWCVQNKGKLPANIRLLNIVWDYDCDEYHVEEKEGLEYIGFANLTFRNLFDELGVKFKVEYVRYSDFLNRVDWTLDMERRNYLKRYEFYPDGKIQKQHIYQLGQE